MAPRNTLRFPFRAGAALVIAAVVIIAGYTLYAALPYLLGPHLSVTQSTAEGVTTIVGRTARVSFLSIDGGAVALQEDGSFEAKRAYPMGYTAIDVSVKDRFGRNLDTTLTFLNK